MQTHGARRFDKLGRPAIANIVRRAEGLDQDSDETFFPIAKTPPQPRVSAGRGVRRDPLGEARDHTLRRCGGSTLSHLRAMILEDFQIAN